jgi:hypothetical protein
MNLFTTAPNWKQRFRLLLRTRKSAVYPLDWMGRMDITLPLSDDEPRLVNWFWQNGRMWRRVWDSEQGRYGKSVHVPKMDVALLLTQYETRIANKEMSSEE